MEKQTNEPINQPTNKHINAALNTAHVTAISMGSVVMVEGICNLVGSGVFDMPPQCQCRWQLLVSVKARVDNQYPDSHWLLLLCFKLGHVVYLSVICCLAFLGRQYAPCIAGQSALFPSPHA